jgi:SnoaL-like domain
MTRDALVRDATQLGRQLQQIGNRSAVTDLVNRLGVWLDEKRFDEVRSIFTENAASDTPGGWSVQGLDLLG